jgi:hypothetical protein
VAEAMAEQVVVVKMVAPEEMAVAVATEGGP